MRMYPASLSVLSREKRIKTKEGERSLLLGRPVMKEENNGEQEERNENRK